MTSFWRTPQDFGICILATLLRLTHATGIGAVNDSGAVESSAQYCIVGAGPGGIQLGHFFDRAGRNYVIFEREATAGNFFREFPRQRKLISINKRFRGDAAYDSIRPRSESFAMRHDWNSLLGNATPPMTERTRELYPSADDLYPYFEDFARGQSILYNTTVTSVSRVTRRRAKHDTIFNDDESTFRVVVERRLGPVMASPAIATTAARRSTTSVWECQNVIVANGIQLPHRPKFLGHEHIIDYADLPKNGSWADGKRVLVLGLGNAGLEAANSVQNWATEIAVLGRPQPLPSLRSEDGDRAGFRFSYHTHYVGDMRQVNLNILDMYQLKSLDGLGFLDLPVHKNEGKMLSNNGLAIFPSTDGMLYSFVYFPCINTTSGLTWEFPRQQKRQGQECPLGHDRFAIVARGIRDRLVLEHFAQKVAKITGKKHKPWAIHEKGTDVIFRSEFAGFSGIDDADVINDFRKNDMRTKKKEKISKYVSGGDRILHEVLMSVDSLRRFPSVMDLVAKLLARKGSNEPLRFGVHAIIRCWGWMPDKSFFGSVSSTGGEDGMDALEEPVAPEWGTSGKMKKYPRTSSVFESINVPNLWFAGALTHGADFRKAAGGFIHGFRYNARATFRAMEWRHHNVHWPFTKFELINPDREEIIDKIHEGEEQYEDQTVENDDDVTNLANWLEYRANNGDGTYQMFGHLVDACVFFASERHIVMTIPEEDGLQDTVGAKTRGGVRKKKKSTSETTTKFVPAHIRCMEEIPARYLAETFGSRPRLSMEFVYGHNHYGPKVFEMGAVGATDGRFAERSTFLHPKLMFWPGQKNGTDKGESTWNHHMLEDVPTSFDSEEHRPFLLRYVRFILSRLSWPKDETVCRVVRQGDRREVRQCKTTTMAMANDDEG
jgi:thioredoxin reductase